MQRLGDEDDDDDEDITVFDAVAVPDTDEPVATSRLDELSSPPPLPLHSPPAKQQLQQQSSNNSCCSEDEHDRVEASVVFSPPLYIQRYSTVCNLLSNSLKHFAANSDSNATTNTTMSSSGIKVVDFGAAECKMFRRWIKPLDFVTQYIAVDVAASHAALAESARHNLKPELSDYLAKRRLPLHARLMCGSVFGCLKPRIVIVTTPNADFNVCFGPSFAGFRHWDHKFEWSRAEFEAWAKPLASQYSYSVEFIGIGSPPAGMESVGHCTQAAVFRLAGVGAAPGRGGGLLRPQSAGLRASPSSRLGCAAGEDNAVSADAAADCRVQLQSVVRHPCIAPFEASAVELAKLLSSAGFLVDENFEWVRESAEKA
uniref:Small RNA 2'-O-methyltransferase n=1 Tax=Macrostomum lignano TaxID=282301 RepID=A0A1I8F3D6_9PLAT